jgi:flagellar protein FliO/FliZ
MDVQDYFRFALALALVLGLMAALVWAMRRAGIGVGLAKGRRLSIVEGAMAGPRHRLLLVRRDDVEHLLLLGPSGQTVVESGIKRAEQADSFQAMVEATGEDS